MFRDRAVFRSFGRLLWRPATGGVFARSRAARARYGQALLVCAAAVCAGPAAGAILWSDLGATRVRETGAGSDILGGVVKRNDAATDTLYFKFHVDPHSDWSTELYFAAFQLYEGDTDRLAVGNSLKAYAYSAFNTAEMGPSNSVPGDYDLHSSRPEPISPGEFLPYELVRHGFERTIVFKVQYVAGGDDLVTVWLNPDLGPGATENSQPESKTTTFKANASFDQIRLRHGGPGEGWTFSDMAIATSFSDFVAVSKVEPGHGAAAAGRGALPLTFRLYQREQGLPQNSVRALAQTRDGYLWVGSDDGVARFDGVRFESFGTREGLRSGRVRLLFEDSRQVLWIGTDGGGLTRRQEGRFTTFTAKEGLPADSVTALAEDSGGRLWVGTEAGLVVWENGHPAPLSAAADFKGKTITTLFKGRHGVMWLGASGAGIFRFVNGNFSRLAGPVPAVEALLQDPHCLLEDQSGRLWVGAGDDYVLCRENTEWRQTRLPRHLARPYVSALVEQSDGTVWAGSVSEGLLQFKQGKQAVIDANSGLSDNFIESLLADNSGNLWVGTGAGLNRLRRSDLSSFGPREGLDSGPVHGLAEIAPGVLWAAQPGSGVYRREGESFSPVTAADSAHGFSDVSSLLVTRDGGCWVAGAHGLLRFSDHIMPDEMDSSLSGLNVISLAEDHQGGVWAGTRDGELWRWQKGKWAVQTNYSQSRAITAIVQDANSGLWLGTDGGGLSRYRAGERSHFGNGDGLLSDFIRTLYLDGQGTLWIGTAGGGLSRWRHGEITTFTTREELPDNTISQILEDDMARLWLGCNRGIACVRKRELEDLAARKITALYPRVYGQAEGLASEECTGGFFPAGLKTKSGLLWFSTLKGIAVADPHPQAADAPAPVVVLEEVLVDGQPVDFSALQPTAGTQSARNPALPPTHPLTDPPSDTPRLVIPPGKHRLEFHYTGLSWSAPDRVRFRYRLEGLDPDWIEAKVQRTAPYPFVPPGEYRFRVTACNSDGVWNEAGAGLPFTALPYFWQARWFLVLAALGLLLSVGGAARVVEKRKHQRRLKLLEQERALERERARIAQDLHDDLGSSLTRISLLSDLAKADKENPRQVEIHANKISQSAGQTVRALEEIVWALRPGSDSLQSLVEYIAHFANEMFEGDTARCRLDLPHDLPARALPPEMRHNIFLVVKEALTNALKHAAAKEVRVQAKVSANWLEIMVQDNGRGFEPKAPPGHGHGLGNMDRRAQAMNGALTLESRPRQGTTITLKVGLPVQAAA